VLAHGLQLVASERTLGAVAEQCVVLPLGDDEPAFRPQSAGVRGPFDGNRGTGVVVVPCGLCHEAVGGLGEDALAVAVLGRGGELERRRFALADDDHLAGQSHREADFQAVIDPRGLGQ
jgi:hypothetical protein